MYNCSLFFCSVLNLFQSQWCVHISACCMCLWWMPMFQVEVKESPLRFMSCLCMFDDLFMLTHTCTHTLTSLSHPSTFHSPGSCFPSVCAGISVPHRQQPWPETLFLGCCTYKCPHPILMNTIAQEWPERISLILRPMSTWTHEWTDQNL